MCSRGGPNTDEDAVHTEKSFKYKKECFFVMIHKLEGRKRCRRTHAFFTSEITEKISFPVFPVSYSLQGVSGADVVDTMMRKTA